MKLNNDKSIATVSLSGTLMEKLYAISNAGFQGVEIFEPDLLSFNGRPEEVAKIISDLGLKNLLFQPFRDFEGSPRKDSQKNMERAKQKFDLMNRLEVDTILVCSNVAADAISEDQIIIDDLRRLAECAAKYAIKIGYEALAWGTYVNTYQHAAKIVQAVDHQSCGLILDSFHTLAINDSLIGLQDLSLSKEKIFFVQLADAPYTDMSLLEWSRHYRCYPGDGDFDVKEFVTKLIEVGYNGPLSLEIFSDKLRGISPRIAAFDGMLAMKNLENKICSH